MTSAMTPLLWISLASLVGAVVVIQTLVTRWAIGRMNQWGDLSHADFEARINAEQRASEAEAARNDAVRELNDEKRLHRLLLASRERKRRAKIEELGEFVERLPVTRQNSEPHAHARFEPIAGTPTTEAGAS